MTDQDWQEQLRQLLQRAGRLRPGETKVTMLEEAARLADAHGDAGQGLEVREALIEAATFGGFPERALAAFAWCRGQQQRDPERIPPERLLWQQKWVVGRLSEFPHIGRKQVESALEDMAHSFEKVGAGQRAVLKLRYKAARDMGDESRTQALWEGWVHTPRDYYSDCRACDLNDELDGHLDRHEYELMLKKARPLLEGHISCAEVPHMTLGRVLYPLFKLGQLERARDLHLRGYELVRHNQEFLATVGEHLEFLALTANVERGLRLFERHVKWALVHASHRYRFTFHNGALALLERARVEGREQVRLALPSTFPLYSPEGMYETPALHGWLTARAEEIATRFDARNGNGLFHRLLARTHDLGAEVKPFPIESALSD